MPLQEPESKKKKKFLVILPKETLIFIQHTTRDEFSLFYCILIVHRQGYSCEGFLKPVYTFKTRFATNLQMQIAKWKHRMPHGHEDPWQVQLKGHSLLTIRKCSAKKTPKNPGPNKASTLWLRNHGTAAPQPVCWCWAQAASHFRIQCISETPLLK